MQDTHHFLVLAGEPWVADIGTTIEKQMARLLLHAGNPTTSLSGPTKKVLLQEAKYLILPMCSPRLTTSMSESQFSHRLRGTAGNWRSAGHLIDTYGGEFAMNAMQQTHWKHTSPPIKVGPAAQSQIDFCYEPTLTLHLTCPLSAQTEIHTRYQFRQYT
ncbi:hypothetical protein [Stenotrophomonas geniculata]|uniref:hypothetical protein n=1 Tax=Stenotrophomonas geniculata TaxID=86188 RepID=UPI0039B082EB